MNTSANSAKASEDDHHPQPACKPHALRRAATWRATSDLGCGWSIGNRRCLWTTCTRSARQPWPRGSSPSGGSSCSGSLSTRIRQPACPRSGMPVPRTKSPPTPRAGPRAVWREGCGGCCGVVPAPIEVVVDGHRLARGSDSWCADGSVMPSVRSGMRPDKSWAARRKVMVGTVVLASAPVGFGSKSWG
jgi:hypothetical protein